MPQTKKKKKLIVRAVHSREGLNAAVADYVDLALRHAERQAQMEQEIAEVQRRHQEEILEICDEMSAHEAGIYAYCTSHRKELFPADKTKSIDCLLARVGFRTHPYAVEKTEKKTTWKDIALRLQALDWGQDFVRYGDPAPDKDALIAHRGELTADQLKQAGLAIVQDESFFIEPKSEVAKPAKQEAA